MFHKENPEYNRRQVGFYTLDELVPKDHFLRKVEETIDFSFIYDLDIYVLDYFIFFLFGFFCWSSASSDEVLEILYNLELFISSDEVLENLYNLELFMSSD